MPLERAARSNSYANITECVDPAIRGTLIVHLYAGVGDTIMFPIILEYREVAKTDR